MTGVVAVLIAGTATMVVGATVGKGPLGPSVDVAVGTAAAPGAEVLPTPVNGMPRSR